MQHRSGKSFGLCSATIISACLCAPALAVNVVRDADFNDPFWTSFFYRPADWHSCQAIASGTVVGRNGGENAHEVWNALRGIFPKASISCQKIR